MIVFDHAISRFRHHETGRLAKSEAPVQVIDAIPSREVTGADLCRALLCDLGAKVGSMPVGEPDGDTYCDRWELFDPEMVSDMYELPDFWRTVYVEHNAPMRRDCVTLRYRYLHAPTELLARYPNLPRRGLFVLLSERGAPITTEDLIWIGNEFTD